MRLVARAVLPVVVGLFVAFIVAGTSVHGPLLTVVGVVVALAHGAALWWRRTHPVLVMGVALVGGLVVQLVAPSAVFPYAGLVAVWALAAARPPWISLPGLGLLLGLGSVNFLTTSVDDTMFVMAVSILPWALGEVVRNRRVAVEQGARRAVSEEQARIARELHDVIAHSLTVMVVQAAAADDVFDLRPDRAREALRSIDATGRATLDELRRLLAEVRPDVHGLGRLDELVAPLRAAGLRVEVRRDGDLRVPAGVDLSAYRIVQEALTNTLRHARASWAEVVVRNDSGVLEVDVRDDGRGGVGGVGRGIAGMRERAAVLGGTVDAGPLPGGGFRVHARLPLAVAS
ncbi:sensor histidine kinase [Actinosynnema sp. CS-041913]|uniref:sensor histidine kinase n=1 Tax=Actinosynnema sp. CS-041913 TaxID=3239917 RepID=UPI003D8C0A93